MAIATKRIIVRSPGSVKARGDSPPRSGERVSRGGGFSMKSSHQLRNALFKRHPTVVDGRCGRRTLDVAAGLVVVVDTSEHATGRGGAAVTPGGQCGPGGVGFDFDLAVFVGRPASVIAVLTPGERTIRLSAAHQSARRPGKDRRGQGNDRSLAAPNRIGGRRGVVG